MANPCVSVVVPVYNAAAYIEKCIETVSGQTYTDWELILVDDCSSDQSVDIIEKHLGDERIRLISQPENLKAAQARNRGIKEAKGRFIAFLDVDDIWDERKLELQLDFMKKKDCAFSYTAYEFGDENARGTGKIVKVLPKINYRKALSRTIIFTSTVMFDLDKLTKEEIMMPDVPSEDTATWWKVLKTGVEAYGMDDVLTVYRRPSKSLSSNKFTAIKRIWNLYRRVEKLNPVYSAYNFVFWAFRATFRRL